MKNINTFRFSQFVLSFFRYTTKCGLFLVFLTFSVVSCIAEYNETSLDRDFISSFTKSKNSVNEVGQTVLSFHNYGIYSPHNPLDSTIIIDNWDSIVQSDYTLDLLTPSLDITPPDPEKMPDEVSPLQNFSFFTGFVSMPSVTLSFYSTAFSPQLRRQILTFLDSLTNLGDENYINFTLITPDLYASLFEDIMLWASLVIGVLLCLFAFGLLIWWYFNPEYDYLNSPIDYSLNKNYYMPIE